MPDINHWFQMSLDAFNSIGFQLVLLISSGILAVSLLLLAMTHWGKSRPVWKCVLLSFAAHIVLMGYAYGTRVLGPARVIAEQSTEDTDEVLNVSFIEDAGIEERTQPDLSSLETSSVQVSTSTPVSLFPDNETAPSFESIEIPPLQRAAIDTELTFEATLDSDASNNAVPEMQETTQDATADNGFHAALPQPSTNDFELGPDFEQTENGFESDLAMLPKAKIIDPEDLNPNEAIESDQSDLPKPQDNLRFGDDGQLERQNVDLRRINEDLLANDSHPADNQFEPTTPRVPLPAPDTDTDWRDDSFVKPIPKPSNKLRSVRRNRRLADGQPLPSIYSLRSTQSRLAVARSRGGSIHTEEAVDKALLWLAQNQEENGSWNPGRHDAGQENHVLGHNRDGAGANAATGISGLATLAFLGAGNTHLEGPYARTVDKAINYLISQQKSNGELAGNAKLFARMYCHSMALLAISESLAITGDHKLYAAVQKGVDYSVAAQNQFDGGWRYQPGDSGDMSQFGWQVMALKSAKLGGIHVPDETFRQMNSFLQSCSSGIGGGLASYRPRQRPTATMTAEAMLCRYFLDRRLTDSGLIEAKRMILNERPTQQRVNFYYWYYGTLAMYHAGGPEWQQWNAAMKESILPLQQHNGSAAGSWPPTGMWGGYGGRVYSTATAALNLEVYYRYLPVQEAVARQRAPQFR